MRNKVRFAPFLAVVLSACASASADVQPTYVSVMQYQSYTCLQLQQEAQAVSARAAQVAGAQDSNRTNDAVMTTVGVVIFWPSLFLLKGNGPTAAELGRLKGDMEAIEHASIQKNCGIQFQHAPPPPPRQPVATRDGEYH